MLLKLPLNQQNSHEWRFLPPSLRQQYLILKAVPGMKERFLPQKKRYGVAIFIFQEECLLGIGNRKKALEKVGGNQKWDDNSRVSLLVGAYLFALVPQLDSTTSTCFVLFF